MQTLASSTAVTNGWSRVLPSLKWFDEMQSSLQDAPLEQADAAWCVKEHKKSLACFDSNKTDPANMVAAFLNQAASTVGDNKPAGKGEKRKMIRDVRTPSSDFLARKASHRRSWPRLTPPGTRQSLKRVTSPTNLRVLVTYANKKASHTIGQRIALTVTCPTSNVLVAIRRAITNLHAPPPIKS